MKTCESCGRKFSCGGESSSPCWCFNLPVAQDIPERFSDCLCEECLMKYSGESSQEVLVEGVDFINNSDGHMVLTREYLLKQGHCCKNGCQNCPYGESK